MLPGNDVVDMRRLRMRKFYQIRQLLRIKSTEPTSDVDFRQHRIGRTVLGKRCEIIFQKAPQEQFQKRLTDREQIELFRILNGRDGLAFSLLYT